MRNCWHCQAEFVPTTKQNKYCWEDKCRKARAVQYVLKHHRSDHGKPKYLAYMREWKKTPTGKASVERYRNHSVISLGTEAPHREELRPVN